MISQDNAGEKFKELPENLAIIKKIKAGDESAFNLFYQKNIGLIKSITNKFKNIARKDPNLFDQDDLEQEAIIAFYKSIMSFNENKGCSFSSYFCVVCSSKLAMIYRRLKRNDNRLVSLNQKVGEEEEDELINLIQDSTSSKTFDEINDSFDVDGFLKKSFKISKPK